MLYIADMKVTLGAQDWFIVVQDSFSAIANPSKAEAMSAYMKYQFKYLGIQKPLRAEATRNLFSLYEKPSLEVLDELVPLLWESQFREYHYFAMECLFHQSKHFRLTDIDFLESLMRKNSWWDSIDYLSPVLAAAYFKKYPSYLIPISKRWNKDKNFWIQRASLLVQLKYKKESNWELQFDLIQNLMHEKEFFIRKAIGWSLRELAKTDAEAVRDFVLSNPLSALSKKEALKHIY